MPDKYAIIYTKGMIVVKNTTKGVHNYAVLLSTVVADYDVSSRLAGRDPRNDIGGSGMTMR